MSIRNSVLGSRLAELLPGHNSTGDHIVMGQNLLLLHRKVVNSI